MSTQLTFRWAEREFSIDVAGSQQQALADVVMERDQQDGKWGEQNHAPIEWLSILSEEVGECSEMANKSHWCNGPRESSVYLRDMRAELVQVAAVAIAAIESLDRNELKRP